MPVQPTDLFLANRNNVSYRTTGLELANYVNSGVEGVLSGMISMWATNTAPEGWLLCNGDAVSRTTYADLFAVIGDTFGTGDGSTTFNLPDYRDRMPIGSGTAYALNAKGGSKDAIVVEHTHTGSTNSTGAHTHNYNDNSSYPASAGGASVAQGTSSKATTEAGNHSHTLTIDSAGSSGTDANLPPYIGIQFIIKT